jgi:hypothetical protein
METKTRAISWENRHTYHFWRSNATARLQEIFKEMIHQLPSSLQAVNEHHFQLLIRLRQRVTNCYQRFLQSHDTILGIIYKILFARSLSSNFQNLQNTIDHILYSSLSNLDISKLSTHEIEQLAVLIGKWQSIPLLKIDWGGLSVDQFKAAYRLKPYASALSLDSLSKEQISSLLSTNANEIQNFELSEIERNLSKIEPQFLSNLDATQAKRLNLSYLSAEQLLELCLAEKIPHTNFSLIDLSLLSSKSLSSALQKNPFIIQHFSPLTVAANLSKFDVKYLTNLTTTQVAALQFSQLTADQLIHLPLDKIRDSQFRQIDLGNFTTASIAKIFQTIPAIIPKLSPSTIAANLTRIDKRYFWYFSDQQLNEIDYNSLTDDQNNTFSWFQQRKMKNYPKDGHEFLKEEHSQNFENWGNYFFFQEDPFKKGHFQTSSHSKKDFFEDFIFSDDFFYNFFADFGFPNIGRQKTRSSFKFAEKPGFRPYESQQSDAKQEALSAYCKSLDSALVEIRKLNQSHTHTLYENLRTKVLTKKNEMMKHPELVFKDDLKSFQLDNLKSDYKKLALAVHPDKNSARKDEATQLFNVVNAAFKALSQQ